MVMMLKLTDQQWEKIRDYFPEEHIVPSRPGRRPIPAREILNAVLWIMTTGAQWHMLPQGYPNYKTVHRRFQRWCRSEVLCDMLTDLANELRETGRIDEQESFIDGMFVLAKGGGEEVGYGKRGKGMKIMGIVDRHGLPLAVSVHAAKHHEVKLVQLCFDFYMIVAPGEAWRRGKACRRMDMTETFNATQQVRALTGQGWPPAGTECCVVRG